MTKALLAYLFVGAFLCGLSKGYDATHCPNDPAVPTSSQALFIATWLPQLMGYVLTYHGSHAYECQKPSTQALK